MTEKLPSGAGEKVDVSDNYPEIITYWLEKGMPRQHIEILSCPAVNEDCLYLYGRFQSYCRKPMEWKLWKDLKEDEIGSLRWVYMDDELPHCFSH